MLVINVYLIPHCKYTRRGLEYGYFDILIVSIYLTVTLMCAHLINEKENAIYVCA